MFGKTKKTKSNIWGLDNPEKLKSPPRTDSVSKQLTDIVNPVKLLDSIFGPKSEGNQASSHENLPPKRANETLVFSYKLTNEDRKVRTETAQLLSELKKQITHLEKSEKSLSGEISKIKVTDIPPDGGIYYLRYFEWMISVVRSLRLKIEEGRAWLAAFNQRKSKKMGYWQKYKKHGTTFGMSQERTLSTQTG